VFSVYSDRAQRSLCGGSWKTMTRNDGEDRPLMMTAIVRERAREGNQRHKPEKKFNVNALQTDIASVNCESMATWKFSLLALLDVAIWRWPGNRTSMPVLNGFLILFELNASNSVHRFR